MLLFNARSLLRGRTWGLLKEMRLCVSSFVSSKCDPAGLLKQLAALRPISCAMGSLAELELLESPSEGRGRKQGLSEAPRLLPTSPTPCQLAQALLLGSDSCEVWVRGCC